MSQIYFDDEKKTKKKKKKKKFQFDSINANSMNLESKRMDEKKNS